MTPLQIQTVMEWWMHSTHVLKCTGLNHSPDAQIATEMVFPTTAIDVRTDLVQMRIDSVFLAALPH